MCMCVCVCVYFTRKLLYKNIFQQYFMHDIFKKKCIIYELLVFLQKLF